MGKVFGSALISAPFIGLAAGIVATEGWLALLIIFGGVAAAAASLIAGVALTMWKGPTP